MNKRTALDLLTDKAEWTATCIRPHLADKSDDSFSSLFHMLREHYALATTEILMESLGTVHGRDDEELNQLRAWKKEQQQLDDLLNRGNKDRAIKTERGEYYDG